MAYGDIQALYAYFMHGVAPVDTAPPATQLAFPFSQRWLMFGWNLLFLDRQRFEASADKSPQWNRGKYLVNTVGHCGACQRPAAPAARAAADQAGVRAGILAG